jgi:metal-dependent amidase/aminoacylase/carboxypeptidase family protein
LTPAVQEKAEAQVRQLAGGIAAAHGATAEVEIRRGYPATVNHAGPSEFLGAVASAVLPAGEARRIPAPSMGGEDFAYYLQRVPGAYFFLGVSDGRTGGYPSLHHPGYDFNDQALPVGIKMLVHAALAYADTNTP